jgi:hypothetical protein
MVILLFCYFKTLYQLTAWLLLLLFEEWRNQNSGSWWQRCLW